MAFAGSHIYSLPSQNSRNLPKTPYSPKDLTSVKAGRGQTFLLQPFDITFDTEGRGVISDAAGNGLAVASQTERYASFIALLRWTIPNIAVDDWKPCQLASLAMVTAFMCPCSQVAHIPQMPASW